MAEDYKPRPSGGSGVGMIVAVILAAILLPLVCCGLGGVSLYWVRTNSVPAPATIQTAPPMPTVVDEGDLAEPPGIVLPSDIPTESTTPTEPKPE